MARSDLSPAARRAMDARAGIARQDMPLGLSGLVKPVVRLKKGKDGKPARRGYIENLRQSWNGGEIILNGPEIDAQDLGVLLACAALALRDADRHADLKQSVDIEDLLATPPKNQPNAAADKLTFTLETTLAALCREIGRDPEDGRAHQMIRDSFVRLSSIVTTATSGACGAFTHLIKGGAWEGRNAVSVTLNYRLTRAMLGEGSFGRVRMQVFRNLSPVGQVLYHWLACWRPGYGTCPPIGLDTLARHVWGEDAKGATARERRQQLRKALAELPTDEWSVGIDRQLVRIERKNIEFSPEPVFLATPTRVLDYASPSENRGRIKLPHERGEREPGCADGSPASPTHPTPAPNPPLPGLVTAACPAPAGALAFGRQHDGDQTSVAETGTVAGDEENRPHIFAGSICGRPTSKNSLLTGLIARTVTSTLPTTRKSSTDESDAYAGHSSTWVTHG
ncbi:Replication C family protein (modular protein) [Thiomonas sp. X19]|uniref:replication protein C, IncQ-type n=1 Tax=Thiomonas sp. X19 TaxID=1050370 RepID=UPI000B67D93C|nr:replication protein C, IncQ-type [Thiomonas sp. X19]SCC92968.1 Replication C family protein (modular protein) [Thiomonas sp. X19]